MEITINGNVTINTTEAKNTKNTNSECGRHSIDRTNEVLISNETSFSELIKKLRNEPEAALAEKIEAEEKEREEEEERKRKEYGEDYDLIVDSDTKKDSRKASQKQNGRRPRPGFLQEYVPMMAKIEFASGGYCEVYKNGYAIYDNGNRKVVLWAPDCKSATYYFGALREKEKDYMRQRNELNEDVLGPLPWYQPLMVGGENRIEFNMNHPKSKGNTSDSDIPEEWEKKENYFWSSGAHFDSPEEAYLKKEAAEERRKCLTEKQRAAYILYYEYGYTQEQIAQKLGVDRSVIRERLQAAKKIFKKDREKYFFE